MQGFDLMGFEHRQKCHRALLPRPLLKNTPTCVFFGSHQTRQVVRFCLQKNPKERPNCASLLSKKFFKRDLQPDCIVKELLILVPVVGEDDAGLGRRELG